MLSRAGYGITTNMRLGAVSIVLEGKLMNTHNCCAATERDRRGVTVATVTTDRRQHSVTVVRWCLTLGGWLVLSALLVLVPKCPACLAAYMLMGTGIGLSLSTARTVQMLLMFLCIASLAYLTARHRKYIRLVISQAVGTP